MGLDDSSDNQPKTSKFNAAALINLTLSELWKDAYVASKNAKLSQWNSILNCIWIELGGDVEKDSTPDKDFNNLNKGIQDAGGLISIKANGFVKLTPEQSKKLAGLYQILLSKSLFLKRLQYKQGKGTAYEDGSDAYMDN